MRLGAPVPFVDSHFEFKAIFVYSVYKICIEHGDAKKKKKKENCLHAFVIISFQSLLCVSKTRIKVCFIKPKRCLSCHRKSKQPKV